jgi:hypothetical protein
MAKKRAIIVARETESGSSIQSEPDTAKQIMAAAAHLYLKGDHLTVTGIAQLSGISRVTIGNLFKSESGAPTVKAIEDRIITTVLSQTRHAIFEFLRTQDPVVAENPLYQLITVFRAVLDVFRSNPMGRFVAHRLTDLQDNQSLALMFSRIDEMLQYSSKRGQLESQAGVELRRLRLTLFGILRGLLMLLPSELSSDAKTHARGVKLAKAKPQDEPITAQLIEVEFLRIIQLHVSDEWKGHIDKYIAAAARGI